MSRHPQFYHIRAELAARFPRLAPAFVAGLALWVLGMILAKSCGLTAVAGALADGFGLAFDSVRGRLKDFYREGAAKSGSSRGVARTDLDADACYAPLLGWVLSLCRSGRVVLALDATNLADRFHVLCVSVVFCGTAVPVAWRVLPAGVPDPWNPHWFALLELIRPAVGGGREVLVLTDRGLESSELFRRVVGCGWHPLMRLKGGGTFRPDGWAQFRGLRSFAPRVGCRFAARGCAYKEASARLDCTLVACWEAGYEHPWLLLTDLPPGACPACRYAMRSWIEQQFKVMKGGGWQWQKTRMTDAGRAARLWLALAVATLWATAAGAEAEEEARTKAEAKAGRGRGGRPRRAETPTLLRRRRRRLFAAGLDHILNSWLRGRFPVPRIVVPEPWPEEEPTPTPTEQEFMAGQNNP